MSEEMRNDTRRKVTNVGNSWIICESRSHQGLLYYFNTLTGEAVWNISDSQIEKAKRTTKHLEKLRGGEPIKCPEPKDKPPSTLKKSAEPSVPSEQFVTNKFSEQQSSVLTYTNMENSNATFHTPFNQISGLIPGNNNSFLNTTATIYNPKVWALPHTQQIFIAPAVAPVVNHGLGPLNVALSQTVSQPATGLIFNHFNNGSQSTTSGRTFYPREFSHDQGVKRIKKTKNVLRNNKDLRQKISLMKRFNKQSIIPGASGLLTANINTRQADITTRFINQAEGIQSKKLGTGMESRCEEKQLHNTLSKIDLGPLKCLAAPDSNSDAWYIVVDLEVLLHEFKFLTTLTDSDDKCHLMVPNRVMEELKTYVTCTENIQAKRILRFLSQQIEIGYAYLAKEPSKVEGDSMADVILASCKELLDNKYHLILLSNDNEILDKGSSNINVFSIDDVKKKIMENSNKVTLVSPGPKMPFMTNELINKIKIIVPNDVPHNIYTSPTRDTQSSNHIDNISPKQNNTPDKPDKVIVLKHTVDAGIQTDLEEINASMMNMEEKQPPSAVSKSKQTITKHSVSVVSNTPAKKREILLKRSTSHQPTINSDETEKKQFKWRRRRNTSQGNEKTLSNNNQNNTNNVESQNNTLNNEILYKLPDRPVDSNPALRFEIKISDRSIESKDSSIYSEPNATTKENVTVGKPSTSGTICNTESNVDDDSTYSNSTNSINQEPVYNKVMYEVENVTMEQYLSTKCEEWVSRFIQIMEEVLSQVLQQDPKFTHEAMPPPWTLHEAAQCIVLKFRGHQGITAAANQLSNILFQVSDTMGKIIEMTPKQYMQMYSYSVHLLDAIMEVAGSEDTQIAVESLNKLLYDIRNPNIENSNNNAFSEDRQDDMSNYDVSAYSDVPSNSDDDDVSMHEQEMLLKCSHTEEVRNDEPKENISCEEELQKPIKFIRNIDIPFPLKKTLIRQRSNRVNNFTGDLPIKYRETQHSTVSQREEGNNSQNANETPQREIDSDVQPNQPKIIRTFTKCPMLERNLRNNKNEQRHDAKIHDQTDKGADTTTPDKPESLNDVAVDLNDENNKKFKYMMHTFLQEIKDALTQVQVLCDQCYEEFLEPKQSTAQKYQLQKKAERAQLHILRLSRSLESMLDHEANNPTQSMSALLEQADIDIHHVDAELLVGYRTSVEKCKDYTDEFLSSIVNIISDVTRFLGREAIDHASDLKSVKT